MRPLVNSIPDQAIVELDEVQLPEGLPNVDVNLNESVTSNQPDHSIVMDDNVTPAIRESVKEPPVEVTHHYPLRERKKPAYQKDYMC